MTFNALFASAPEFHHQFGEEQFLGGKTPYVAMTTASLAVQTKSLVDNWTTPEGLQDGIFIMQHWEGEKEQLREKLTRLQPTVFFISTFAMNFPGAIAVATMVREVCGDNTLIVLGGRHPSETFYRDIDTKKAEWGNLHENKNSNPLRLMQEGKIPLVFDMVISGDGTDVLPKILSVARSEKTKNHPLQDKETYCEALKSASGYFEAGYIDETNEIQYIHPTDYTPVDTTDFPSPYIARGVDATYFSVFDQCDWTAHVHSDSRGTPGNTCVMQCDFCSESGAKNHLGGGNEDGASDRLIRRMNDIASVGESAAKRPSTFVEDSILLGGSIKIIEDFASKLENIPAEERPIQWGCQFTIGNLVTERFLNVIKRLKECGLSYIYFGLESTNPSSVITIHKATNGNGKEVSWEKRAETAVKNLHEMGIQIGISNIFCMHPDEKQSNRIKQLSLIHEWQEKYPGTIVSLSLNIQTVHAGDMVDGEYPLYDYTRWGLLENDPRSPLIQELFGEATIGNPRYPEALPTLEDLQEIKRIFGILNRNEK